MCDIVKYSEVVYVVCFWSMMHISMPTMSWKPAAGDVNVISGREYLLIIMYLWYQAL